MRHVPKGIWKRSKTVRFLLWAMLAAGLLLIAMPRMDEALQEHKQNDLLTAWDDQNLSAPPTPTDHPVSVWKEIDGMPVLGTITVDKIGLHEPLLQGAGEQSLQLGIGVVTEDGLPGGDGNFVLAGHRSFKPGKHFNRLPELERGDSIVIESAYGTFAYAVDKSYLVSPDDLSVLDSRPGAAELTLITCHPMRNPTHRLIVKATLQEARSDQVAVEDKK